MRGVDELVAARMHGAGITLVAVTLTDAPVPKFHQWINENRHAFVEITSDDRVQRLDLRCVAGLPVVVTADGGDWIEVVERLIAFDPKSIVAHGGEYAVRWTKKTGLEEWNE